MDERYQQRDDLNRESRFLGVDALWALCMAFNVHLALFRGWTAQRMQAQEWKYFIACYGFSFIPALVYLFINVEGRGKVYGPALVSTPPCKPKAPANPGTALVLDHWRMGLSPHRDSLRHSLVRLNDPAPKPTSLTNHRVALISAFVIYCMAGAKVWRNRRDLHEWFNPFNENPFESTVTTEVDVTTHVRRAESPSSMRRSSDGEMPIYGIESQGGGDYVPYTVNVEVGPQDKRQNSAPELFRMRTLTRNAALNEANADAWLYARVAFLFFCALLISWVPSSTNRVYSSPTRTALISASTTSRPSSSLFKDFSTPSSTSSPLKPPVETYGAVLQARRSYQERAARSRGLDRIYRWVWARQIRSWSGLRPAGRVRAMSLVFLVYGHIEFGLQA